MIENNNLNTTLNEPVDAEVVTKETDGEPGVKITKIQKIIVVVLAILFVCQTFYEIRSFIPGFEKKYFIKNFSDHRETMEKWVDKMAAIFDSEKEIRDDLLYIDLWPFRRPSNNNGVFELSCFLEDGEKYTIEIPATDDDYDELANSQCDILDPEENSGEAPFSIFVTNKQVSFKRHRYATVYSRSGWKPEYVIRPTENYAAYRVTRINFHWYHVVGFDHKWLFFVS